MSGEAILSAENGGKPLGGRGSVPNPGGRAHSAPPDLLAGGQGLAAPSPRTHHALGLRNSGFDYSPYGPGHALANTVAVWYCTVST